MAQDITAREAAEEKVRQLDAEQRESLDCLPVAMLRVDRKGVLEMVNRAMLRLLKCKSSAELLGKNLTSEGILDSDDFQLLKRRAMRSREFRNLHIHWFTGPNLGYLLRLSGREVRDETGRLRAVEAVVEDQRVLWDAEVTAGKLNTAAEFADDFAQQLTTMLGCADLLVLHGKLEEEDRKIASTLAEAAVKARNLGERAQELFWAPRWLPRTVDLNQFAEEIEEFYRPLLDERVEWVSDLAPDTGYVRADRQRLTEMTFHLVNHGRRLMPEGGKLTLTTQRVFLPGVKPRPATAGMLFDAFPGEYAGLRVTHTGADCETNWWPDLVEHWKQVEPGPDGRGWALEDVQLEMAHDDGFVRCMPVKPRGMILEMLLRSRRPVDEPPPRPQLQLVKGPAETTILVMGQAGIARERAVEFLRAEQYQVLEAGSAEEAVATVKGHEGGIDLIFAEEWLNASIEKKVLPKLGLRRNPPAVLYTDHSGAPMEHLVRLKQPYLRHELVSRVREMLGQTREERLLSAFSLKQLKKSDLSRRKEGDSPQPCERPSP